MSKVKLKTKDSSIFGKQLNVAVDGKVKVSKNGILLVSEEAAETLLRTNGLFFSETKEPEEEEPEETEENENSETEEEDEEGQDSVNLNDYSLSELIELAKESGIKEPSYRKHKGSKKAMVKFLSEKLK